MHDEADRRAMQALDLPFDQYQRYRIIQEVIEAIRSDAPMRVLDVGGSPGTLRHFLDSDQTVIVDLDAMGSDVCANGLALPFDDDTFDAVVSSDTLEHVPPDMRQGFLGELMRVSKSWLVIGAPFDDPQVVQAEEVMETLMLARYGEVHHCLQEHRSHGLPSLDDTLTLLRASGYETLVLHNGYLYNWLVGLSVFWLLQWRFRDANLSGKVNAFYNAHFYEEDNREPSYRKVVVAGPTLGPGLLSLANRVAAPEPAKDADRLVALQILNLLVQVLIERWSDQGVKLEDQLAQLEGQLAQLQTQLVQKNEIIDQLSRDLDDRYLLLRTLWRKARGVS